jgi:hypothetical protein
LEKYTEIDLSLVENNERGFFNKLLSFNREIEFIEYGPKVFRNILMLDSINYDELLK